MDKLELRKKIKNKMPKFVRTDIHKKKKLAVKWRKPKGIQNKMRLRKKGYRGTLKIGYGSPSSVKNMLSSGLMGVIVNSLKDIQKINPKTDGIIISKNVGLKKRLDIAKVSKEKKLTIVNIKNIDLFIKETEEMVANKRASKKDIVKEKEKKKQEREEKAKEKEDNEKKEDKNKTEDDLAKKIEEEEHKKEQEKKKVLLQKE